ELTKGSKTKPKDFNFGKNFTDHMFIMDYDEGIGWHNQTIKPYGPLAIDPSCSCLHYGQEIFEGLKAYRTKNNVIQLFRPLENFKRMNASCDRMCIPSIDEEVVLNALITLLKIDSEWVPYEEGATLYIRPFIIATENTLGVHRANSYKFIIIMSPSGAYYANGLSPIKIFVEKDYVRAVPGGTGTAKTGGNYAASIKSQNNAKKAGYNEVLWLDGIYRKYIEEVGAMNIFFRINDKIITPKLNGSILCGITRDSIIQLIKDWNLPFEERKITIDEIIKAYDDNTLQEVWGTGTAAVVSPVGTLGYDNKILNINNNKIGDISKKLYDNLTGIQFGKLPDSHNLLLKL
ncbi:MAG: branched-chain amino acid aminotransferase, partial [Oscillospiraceae bacterium]|nr:branched-chain amino acid aminotransferase [Oscillospiraceae bacterium]